MRRRSNPASPGSRAVSAATLRNLGKRARLVGRLRAFLTARGYLEVETPLISPYRVPDRHLVSVPAGDGFLQTSPEFAMKRLLAAGSGPIFQIGKAFRGGEQGRRHAVEFTIAEWYRPGPLAGLLREMDLLLQDLLLVPSAEAVTWAGLFRRGIGVDPFAVSDESLQRLAEAHGHPGQPETRTAALEFLFSRLVEPGLGAERPVFVTHYPADMAALARLTPDDPRTSERFEVFYQGLELANGYDELQDPEEHRRRFAADNRARAAAGLPPAAPDPRFLAALEDPGLPRCSGVALGVDRLVMAAVGAEDLDEVIAFREDAPATSRGR